MTMTSSPLQRNSRELSRRRFLRWLRGTAGASPWWHLGGTDNAMVATRRVPAPGANLGWEYAVFEPVHGSAPDIAGRAVANPIAIVRSAAMLLRHLKEPNAARAVEEAVERVLAGGEHVTRDLGGTASTDEMASALAAAVKASR